MNLLIIGAGAIGCLVGGKLALQGQSVTLVGRPAFAATVREQGLRLTDERGAHHITAVNPVGSIAEAFQSPPGNAGGYDVAVLTVKSYDTEAALQELMEALEAQGADRPAVLCLQNGVGNEEAIAARLTGACVIAGTITTPVTVSGPGAIQVDKPSYTLGISPWHPAVSKALLGALHRALQQAGFSVVLYPDPRAMKWTKLLMNMMGNATCAILDEPPEEVFRDPTLVDLEIEAWRETLAVMRAVGISPVNLGSYPFSLLAPLVRTLPKAWLRPVLRAKIGQARGGKMPSLHIDLARGRRKSEIRWLNGAVVRQGEEVGVGTPINRMLTEVLLRLAEDEEQRALWRHDHLRLALTASEYRAREAATPGTTG